MERILTAELEKMTDDQLQKVRREHAEDGTRRRAKKLLKKRGVELIGEVNMRYRSWSRPKPTGKIVIDDDAADRSEACVKASVDMLVSNGGKIEHRSDSGSVYVRLSDGRLIRVSNHCLPPNAIRDMRDAEFNSPWDEEIICTGQRQRHTPEVARQRAAEILECE